MTPEREAALRKLANRITRLSTPIAKYLRRVPTWVSASPEIRAAFRVRMRGHAYGRVPCRQAWEFFYSGCHWGLASQVRVQSITQAVEARHSNAPVDGDAFP